ncbi:hypothetical protein ACJJTC_010030 [Scirpophaga incertulas]
MLALDPDAGENGTVRYWARARGAARGLLRVHARSGRLLAARPLARRSYELTVRPALPASAGRAPAACCACTRAPAACWPRARSRAAPTSSRYGPHFRHLLGARPRPAARARALRPPAGRAPARAPLLRAHGTARTSGICWARARGLLRVHARSGRLLAARPLARRSYELTVRPALPASAGRAPAACCACTRAPAACWRRARSRAAPTSSRYGPHFRHLLGARPRPAARARALRPPAGRAPARAPLLRAHGTARTSGICWARARGLLRVHARSGRLLAARPLARRSYELTVRPALPASAGRAPAACCACTRAPAACWPRARSRAAPTSSRYGPHFRHLQGARPRPAARARALRPPAGRAPARAPLLRAHGTARTSGICWARARGLPPAPLY